MNTLSKIYCRTFQTVFKLALPFLPYREPVIFQNVEEMSATLSKNKLNNVLIVTDKQLTDIGLVDYITSALCNTNITYHIYNETTANPTNIQIEDAAKLYKANSCKAIIALGGGSPIDCAKGCGVRIARPNTPLIKMKGILRVIKKLPPIIAIPTTAGTGSEVTLAAVITDAATHHKYTICDFPLIPAYALHDPKMTESLPKGLIATTGMDALTHAIEVYIGNSMIKRTKAYATEAIKLIFDNLTKVYDNPSDINARKQMLRAAYLAGNAFSQSYVGYIHAVAHSLGGEYGIPHGLANATLLPIVLRYYDKAIYKKLASLSVLVGIAKEDTPTDIAALEFIEAIENMNRHFGIGKTFEKLNSSDIPKLAKYAAKEANPLYPVPVLMDKEELTKIYHLVLEK